METFKTEEEFRSAAQALMRLIYKSVKPNTYMVVATGAVIGDKFYPSMFYPGFISRGRALLMVADTMLGLNYDFRDVDQSNMDELSRETFESLSEQIQPFTDMGMLVFIRALCIGSEFGSLIFSNVQEKDQVHFLGAFKTVPKTGYVDINSQPST